jgi:hypothetical protein
MYLLFKLLIRLTAICSLIFLLPSFIYAVNVKDFGAKGDGKTDDTPAINAAILGATDGIIEFPRGSYKVSQTIFINLSKNGTLGITGKGGSASIIMTGEGPTFCFIGSHDEGTALPSSVKPITWEKERMPLIDALEIVGANPKADGIEIKNTIMPVFRALLIRNVRNGLHFTARNRNILINECHIYNTSEVGIYLDHVNIHQMIISNSHISYCLKGGIKLANNSQIRDLQITGNDIEYNFDPTNTESADILIDCSKGGAVREGTISGNTIQALSSPGGANIRFNGPLNDNKKIGLWSITGNHISNQEINIQLEHCSDVSITGNTFINGANRHLIINDGRNIIFSNNVISHNLDYFRSGGDTTLGGVLSLGGISVNEGQDIILNNNIINEAGNGTVTDGGAIVIKKSREISLNGCHIKNPKINGIQIDNSVNVQIADCIIHEDNANKRMLTAIALTGLCPGTVIRDNNVSAGKKGSIINNATGVKIKENIFTDLILQKGKISK